MRAARNGREGRVHRSTIAGGSSGGGGSEVQFIGTSSQYSSGINLAMPVGTAVGDIVIGVGAALSISGWTAIDLGDINCQVFYKRMAVAGDLSVNAAGYNGAQPGSVVLATFRGAQATGSPVIVGTPVTASAKASTGVFAAGGSTPGLALCAIGQGYNSDVLNMTSGTVLGHKEGTYATAALGRQTDAYPGDSSPILNATWTWTYTSATRTVPFLLKAAA